MEQVVDPVLERVRAAVARVLPDEGVELACLVGSRARGDARPGSDVDLVLLDDAPLPLRGRVAREGVVLWPRDEGVRAQRESRTSRELFDFEIFMASLEAELLAAHAQGRR